MHRYFKLVDGNGSWRWDKDPLLFTEDISGNAGCHLDWFTTVERTIAFALCRRDPCSACTLVNTHLRQHLQTKNIE